MSVDLEASFSDYDHENERHVELQVRGRKVSVSRWLDFNADYAPDVEPPPDWSDSVEHDFENEAELAAFLQALGEALIQNCFSYFPKNIELASDEARAAWARFLERIPAEPSGVVDTAAIDAIVDFPR
jgi:hypothetical protein